MKTLKRLWMKIRGIKTPPATITLEKIGNLTAIKKNGVLLAYSDLPLSTDGEFITGETIIRPENIMIAAAALPPLQFRHDPPELARRIDDLRYRPVDPTGGALLREAANAITLPPMYYKNREVMHPTLIELVDSITSEQQEALLALYAAHRERGGRSFYSTLFD